jgi:MFS transporter, PHS family, inorganic phosphate transporter
MMNAVFAMQGIGQLMAGIMLLIVTAGFRDSLSTAATPKLCSTTEPCIQSIDKMWRIMIGFGAVPGAIALYFRLTIPETPRYTFDVERDVQKAVEDVSVYREGKWGEGDVDEVARAADKIKAKEGLDVPKASWGDFAHYYRQWKHLKVLLGTALSWFFLVS